MTINVFSDPSSKNLSIYTHSGRASLRSLQTYGIESKSKEQKRKIVSRQISKTKNSFLMQLAVELEIKLGKK